MSEQAQNALVAELQAWLTAEAIVEESEVPGPDDDLLAADVLDSMSVTVLATTLEERHGIVVAPTDFTFENFATLRSIAALVLAKLG